MSLVNDMLRDLDARRKAAAPTSGAAADLLPPASPQTGGRRLRKVVSGVLLVTAAGAALVVALAGWRADSGDEVAAVLTPVTVPPAAAEPVPTEAPESPALAALNERLTALEAQNAQLQAQAEQARQALQDSEQRAAEQAREAERRAQALAAQTEQLAAARAVTPLTALPAADAAPTAPSALRDSAAPAATAVLPSPAAQAPSVFAAQSAGASTLQRTERELTLRDRDRQRVQDALRLWAANEQHAALQLLDSFAVEHPEAHQSRETLAKLLIERGDTAAALQAADIGLSIAPQHAGYRKVRARLLLGDGRAPAALELLAERPPALRNDPEYHDLLASAALAAGDYQRALLVYEQLLDHDGSVGRWWYGLAAALDARGQRGGAIQAYEQALRSVDLGAGLRQLSATRLNQLQQ